MAVNFNFFTWIRDGVKQSVLMGVSDAVGHLGTPREGDEVHQRLTSFLQQDPSSPTPPRLPSAAGRKKLGRTLGEIQADAAKAT
jgi:hypothetical protein